MVTDRLKLLLQSNRSHLWAFGCPTYTWLQTILKNKVKVMHISTIITNLGNDDMLMVTCIKKILYQVIYGISSGILTFDLDLF